MKSRHLPFFTAESLESRRLLSAPLQLVADVNRSTASSSPADAVSFGGLLYFAADNGANGAELWRSNGTSAGTTLVTDIRPGTQGSAPAHLTVFGDAIFFTANDGVHGAELWRSDGTKAGTRMVANIRAGAADSSPFNFVTLGKSLYFLADDSVRGYELWRTDGTSGGTRLVKDINPGAEGSGSPDWGTPPMAVMGGSLYLSAFDAVHGIELWRSDGTAGGTTLVKDIYPGIRSGNPRQLTAIGTTLYFAADDGASGTELWKSNGTATGTKLIKDIRPGTITDESGTETIIASSNPHEFRKLGSQIYFFVNLDQNSALWKTDGTAAGTRSVFDDFPSYFDESAPGGLQVAGSALYFTDAYQGGVLYRSNGTASGTVVLKRFGDSQSFGASLTLSVINGKLFLNAADSQRGNELWTSDGTSSGTKRVKDIRPGVDSSSPSLFTAVGDRTFFSADDGLHGRELWITDSTAAGTRLVKDINSQPGGTGPTWVTTTRHAIYFVHDDGTHGRELWTTDGTAAGTRMVLDLYPGPNHSDPRWLAGGGDLLYFAANDGTHGEQLWSTNGTAAGTHRIGPGSTPKVIGNTLYFRGEDGFYQSTGTAGTTKPFALSTVWFDISSLTPFKRTLYLSTFDGQLWKTDGTAGGTRLIKDTGDQPIQELTLAGDRLYFTADDGVHGREVWISDGTTAGTRLLRDITRSPDSLPPNHLTAAGSMLYFLADDGVHGQELWRSNGTTSGTRLVKDLLPGPRNPEWNPEPFAALGNAIYFTGADVDQPRSKAYLWKADERSVSLAKTLQLAPEWEMDWATVFGITPIVNGVYFRFGNFTDRQQLWRTDGITGQSVPVANIAPRYDDDATRNALVPFGNKIYLADTDAAYGGELFKLAIPPAGPGSITGRVFNDLDRDGRWDGIERGIGGRRVYIDLDNDGRLGANEPSAITDSVGRYTLARLVGGTYKLRQILPTGWFQSRPPNGWGVTVTLLPGQDYDGVLHGTYYGKSAQA